MRILRSQGHVGALRTLAAFLLAGAVSPGARGEDAGPIVALFDIVDRGGDLPPEALLGLTDFLATQLAKCGYQVIPRDQVKQRLSEQQRESYRECYEENCQIELGRDLAAQKSLATQVLKLGGACHLTSTLFDLEKAVTQMAADAEAPCEEAAMLRAVQTAADKLCAGLRASSGKDKASEFEEFLAKSQAEGEQGKGLEEAWKVVSALARDANETREARLAALRNFLASYPAENPHLEEARNLALELDPGKLTITSEPPGVDCFLGDQYLGVTPFEIQKVAGEYEVAWALKGFLRQKQQVRLGPGENKQVLARMEREPATRLMVRSQPLGALVYLDGVLLGNTPLEKELAPGLHEVRVAKDGFLDGSQTVTVREHEETRADVVLERIYAMNPYKKWGHAAFWTGLGLAALGGISTWQGLDAADRYRVAGDSAAADTAHQWEGVAWASYGLGGALMVAGVVLWALSPGDQEWGRLHPEVSAGVTGDGAVLTWGGRW